MVLRSGAYLIPSLVFCTLLSAGCGGKPPSPIREAVAADTGDVTVDTVTLSMPMSFPSQLYVEHDAVAAARSSGIIDSILVDIGTQVAAGQLLARIESVDQELNLASAQVALDQSERNVMRARALSRVQGVTVADSEQSELQYREAGLALRRAQRALELTRITAPFVGVVTARYVRPRGMVAAGDTLFRVAETGPLLARIRVPEHAALAIRLGGKAAVRLGGPAAIRGTVHDVAPAIDPGSGTREVIIRLDRTAGLIAGSAVSVELGSERRQALAIPRDVVGADDYVLVREGSRTSLRAVVLGVDLGDGRVEVLSGLHAGEHLVRPVR